MSIESQIKELATEFAEALLAAIRSESISSLTGNMPESGPRRSKTTRAPAAAVAAARKSPAPSGRLKRRSAEEIAESVQRVAALLKSAGPLRSEVIREKLGLDVREVPRILKEGVSSKAFKILSGSKRSTTYGVQGAAKAKTTRKAAKSAKKSAKKPTKRPAKKK